MPICAKIVSSACGPGNHVPCDAQLIALDVTKTDLATCTYVVESGAEFANSLLSMTAEQGAMYSAGIVSCWLAAYGIRSIISIIRSSES